MIRENYLLNYFQFRGSALHFSSIRSNLVGKKYGGESKNRTREAGAMKLIVLVTRRGWVFWDKTKTVESIEHKELSLQIGCRWSVGWVKRMDGAKNMSGPSCFFECKYGKRHNKKDHCE